jgi:hypothetical protein
MPENSNSSATAVPENSNGVVKLKKVQKPTLLGNRNNPNLAELGKPYRWQKGQPSPNPGGRPKMQPLTEALRQGLEQVDPEDGLTIAEKIAEAQIRQALQGSVQHLHEIANRVEGQATQTQRIQREASDADFYQSEPGEARQREIFVRVMQIAWERHKEFGIPLPELPEADRLATEVQLDEEAAKRKE